MTDDRPEWDDALAQALVGQTVLVGLTHIAGDEIVRQEQFHGMIIAAIPERGFQLALEGVRDGETYWLPPDPSAFERAPRGEYRLRTTGEVVTDPNLLSTWTINAPQT